MKKMKLIAIFLIVFCMFFSTKNVLAADNPRYEVGKIPSGWSSNSFDDLKNISRYNFYVNEDLNEIGCPKVYLVKVTTYGDYHGNYQNVTNDYSIRLNVPGEGQWEILNGTDTDSSEDKLACKYTWTIGNGTYDFSLYYDRSSDNVISKTKANCTYKDKNNPDNKIHFSLLEDGSMADFYGYSEYANRKLKSGTTEAFYACKPYLKFGNPGLFSSDLPLIPTDDETDWVLESDAALPTMDAQDGFATYVLSSSSKTMIVIKNDGGFRFYENKDGKATEITDKVILDSDTSKAFSSGDYHSYPTYLVRDETTGYTFANKTKFGDNNYILFDKINELYLKNGITIEETCSTLFGDDEIGFLTFLKNNVFRVVYIAVPIILILLTSFDFAKAVFNSDNDGIQGAFKKFGKRVVAAVLIYLVPTIIIFASSLIGGSEISECARQLQNLSSELGDE